MPLRPGLARWPCQFGPGLLIKTSIGIVVVRALSCDVVRHRRGAGGPIDVCLAKPRQRAERDSFSNMLPMSSKSSRRKGSSGGWGVVLAYIPESVDANTQIDVCALSISTVNGFLLTCLGVSGNFLEVQPMCTSFTKSLTSQNYILHFGRCKTVLLYEISLFRHGQNIPYGIAGVHAPASWGF